MNPTATGCGTARKETVRETGKSHAKLFLVPANLDDIVRRDIIKRMGKISIEKLAEMVKNGFDQMATKEALKALATKEDLKAFATKEDLQNGLDGVETRLINQFDDFRDNIRKIKTKIEME